MRKSVSLIFLFYWATIPFANASTNQKPIANDDWGTVLANHYTVIDVLANDIDNNILSHSVEVITPRPINGGYPIIDPISGEISVIVAKDFLDTIVFEYQVCDWGTPTLCDTATVNISVLYTTQAPIAVPDYATGLKDTPITIDVLANDIDNDIRSDIDTATVAIVVPPSGNHTVTVDNTTGSLTFTPALNFTGSVSFVYEVCDNGIPAPIRCDQAMVTILIDSVNNNTSAPIANNDYALRNIDGSPIMISVLDNDIDIDGNIIPSSLKIIWSPYILYYKINIDPTNFDIIFTPGFFYDGLYDFAYEICDDGVPILCDTAIVEIDMSHNEYTAPIALDDYATGLENTPLTIDILANDRDEDLFSFVDPSTVYITNPPGNNHTVTVHPITGAISFTPAQNFTGMASFYYRVCDTAPLYQCDGARVDVTINERVVPLIFSNGNSKTDPTLNPITPQIPPNQPIGGDSKGFNPFGFRVSKRTTNMTVYPNPISDKLTLEITTQSADKLDMTLVDINGRICLLKTHAIQVGKNQIDWKLPRLSNGTYFLCVKGIGHQWDQKVLILND